MLQTRGITISIGRTVPRYLAKFASNSVAKAPLASYPGTVASVSALWFNGRLRVLAFRLCFEELRDGSRK